MSPEKRFKTIIISIVSTTLVIAFCMINSMGFSLFEKKSAMTLSKDSTWQSELEDTNKDSVPDINVELATPDIFANSDNPKTFDINAIEKYWNGEPIPVNSMSNYDNKTKKELMADRKNFVKNSIFNKLTYSPNETLFEQLQDEKPWRDIQTLTCNTNNKKLKPLTAESKFLNNPTILIGIDRTKYERLPDIKCSNDDYLMPIKLVFEKDTNTISIFYNLSASKGFLNGYSLKAINARDLGYNYGYVDIENNILFSRTENSISQKPYKFDDSLGYRNNQYNGYSANKQELNFMTIQYPASIHIKLWNKEPKATTDKADMNYLIILN